MTGDGAVQPGAELTLEVGEPGAGGVCVARTDGRVVFVRFALPGERVRGVVTEVRPSYLRADAVQILVASPDRVEPPCPYFGPGRCGGCDLQHADGNAQRRMKAAVIAEQLRRIAGLDRPVEVEPLPGGLLGWRTAIGYAVDEDGAPGMHRYRSSSVERVERCLLGVPGVGDSDVLDRSWPGLTGVEVVAGDGDERTVIAHRPSRHRRHRRGQRPPDRLEVVDGPTDLQHQIAGQVVRVAATGFWQAHAGAVASFADALLGFVQPRPGERVLELYSGAGALSVPLALAVGSAGELVSLESDATAVADAERNLSGLGVPVRTVRARVDPSSVEAAVAGDRPDLIVLDPPRSGAGVPVMTTLCGLGARAIGYVSCDPASLARDLAAARQAGWELAGLRAFDAFPMTHHVECVAVLEPSPT